MAEALTQIVNLLTNFGTETAKISALTEQAAQCRDILKYIDELKKEAGHAVNQLAQMLVNFQLLENSMKAAYCGSNFFMSV